MKIQMAFPYYDMLEIPFVFLDTISMTGRIKPLFETLEMPTASAVTARLIHDKMTFGVDPFLLAQMDSFTLSMLDSLPLNIR